MTRGLWWSRLLLFAFVALTYVPSLRNELIYDDRPLILRHGGAHSLEDVAQIFREPHFPQAPYYRPITRTTLLLQKAWHGDNPVPFHWFNLLLAGAVAVAVDVLLRRPRFGIPAPIAWGTAALLLVHPVASSCVYPVCSGRETMLPALLMISTLAAYATPSRTGYVLAQFLLLASLFGKEQAIVLPGLLVLADLLGFGRPAGGDLGRRLLSYLPMALSVAFYLWMRHGLFAGTEYQLAITEDPLGPMWSFLFAFQVTVFPFYSLRYEPDLEVWRTWWQLIPATAAFLVVWISLFRRSTRQPWALFWGAWFVVLTLPTANILVQEAPFSERYVFLPALGLLAGVAAVISDLSVRLPGRVKTMAAGGLVVVLLAAGISARRSRAFVDDLTFGQCWLETNPEAAEAHGIVAGVHLRAERFDEALVHAREAAHLDPDFLTAHVNYAQLLHDTGKSRRAVRHLDGALERLSRSAKLHALRGRILLESGNPQEAVSSLQRAVKLQAGNAAFHNSLAIALGKTGDLPAATATFRTALEHNPDYAEARFNLAEALLRSDQVAEATEELQRARQTAKEADPELVGKIEQRLRQLSRE